MKKQIIFLTAILALFYISGCATSNSLKSGKQIEEPSEIGQNLPAKDTIQQELPDEESLENVPESTDTNEETPVLAEKAQEVNNVPPKQTPKWELIGKISKEHPTLLRVLTLHTSDMGKALTIIKKNSSKYSEKYSRSLDYGASVYISKDNELFINKKGGPAPEEVVTVNKKQDNNNETSRPESRPAEKQIIMTPAEEADEGQKFISKDNELFINKKGGPAPEEEATVNKKQDNNNETSRPEYKPEKKQIITAPDEDADEGGKIALNFDNADIYEVINSLSDILGINFIIDPAVKGKVNIHTSSEVSRNRLLPVMETIFDINNIALVKSGDMYKIIPVKNAKSKISTINAGRKVDLTSNDRTIVQVIPLHYVSTSEVINILKPFISSGGNIIEYKKGNIIVATDTAASINKIVNMIDIVDIDTFEHTKINFFKIENADVEELAEELENVFTSLGISKTTEKSPGIGISFIPIERVSCILAVSPIPDIFTKVEHWIKVLDTVDTDAEEQVFIYFVENGKAEEITDVLENIYEDGNTKSRSSTSSRSKSKKTKTQKSKKPGQTSFIQGEIKIVHDEATNSIIVRATPHDYAIIKKTIQTMDIIPKQVLIEVLIAEVTLGDATQFGVEWALRDDYAKIGGYKGKDQIGNFNNSLRSLNRDNATGDLGDLLEIGKLATGLSYVFDSDRLKVFLQAQADENKLNVLSSPNIMAADNQEARIEVGEEVPIVTSEYVPLDTGSSSNSNTSTSRSIEYRNTGVILTVTPRINDKGLVAMDITQEVSQAQEISVDGIQSPVISNRKAETSLVVQNNQTVVIGGIIDTFEKRFMSGIPYLKDIPFIGFLFGTSATQKGKKELILLITPHVIETINEAESVTREIREKIWRRACQWMGFIYS